MLCLAMMQLVFCKHGGGSEEGGSRLALHEEGRVKRGALHVASASLAECQPVIV